MRNIKMVVAYDGTRFAGFQRQAGNILTIQGILEESIAQIIKEQVSLIGAGRTDAGVHAKGQMVNFHTTHHLETEKIIKALNSILPEDILIREVSEAAPGFHARYSAKSKMYSYRIHHAQLRPLFNRRFVYHYRHCLDPRPMQDAAVMLLGSHDFRSFQATGSSVKTTVRFVHSVDLSVCGPELIFTINANGFLYHMVRNIVGTLLLVGNGRITPDEFGHILRAGDRTLAGATAPAKGLCLEEVFYEE